jgi:hypothetical protein
VSGAPSDDYAGLDLAPDGTLRIVHEIMTQRRYRWGTHRKKATVKARAEHTIVKRYIEMLAAAPTERAILDDLPSVEEIQTELGEIRRALPRADALTRLHLIQRQGELRTAYERRESNDPALLEYLFIAVGASWAQRHRITHEAFLAQGVPYRVLIEAGIAPTPPPPKILYDFDEPGSDRAPPDE